MSSSGTDQTGQWFPGRRYSLTGSWIVPFLIISVLTNMMFTGFVLLKLSQEQKRAETAETNLKTDINFTNQRINHVRESAYPEMKQQLNDMLSEYGKGIVKRSAPSPPSQSSGIAANIGNVFVSLIKQMCKPEGSICIPGEPGRDGLPGPSGSDGRDGQPGRDGRIGLPGPAGDAGRDGKHGSKGSAGKQGPRGVTGMKGELGQKGETGVKGDRGEKGAAGLQGRAGPQGEKGETGGKGERGWTGFKGEKGTKGTTGLPGGKGMKGETSVKGVKGDKQDFSELQSLPSQCLSWNHRVLNEIWRQTSQHFSKTRVHCDKQGHGNNPHGFQPGWHSFSSTVGGKMPDTCTPQYHCGTRASGWLKGSHPTVIGQKVTRTVCFRWSNNCCYWQTSVEVINCGLYHVYNLPNTPGCDLGYCARGPLT